MTSLSREDLIKAIHSRHSVRQYDDTRTIETSKLDRIRDAIESINRDNEALSFRLVCDEPLAFGGRWASYGNFQGVRHYIVISALPGRAQDVDCGRRGEELVLLIQHLGLSSCWVGLTYKKVEGAFEIPANHSIRCLIAFGYAKTDNFRHHKIKTPQQVSNINAESPSWFKEGVSMALLAPTAVNQQKFYFELTGGNIVKARARFSLIGYSHIDLGIAMTHFRIGANNEQLELIVT